ncbi:hypothetical protein Ddc_10524 [Ditylenchus destructor]|nr:hypothetical protein Ddc_10524 [Ditylenchus destructor]
MDMHICLTYILMTFLLVISADARRKHPKRSKGTPSIHDLYPAELKEALLYGRIPSSVTLKLDKIISNTAIDFLEKQDRIDKCLLANLPNDLIDQMLDQSNGQSVWLEKLPLMKGAQIKAISRDRRKTWAHKFLELEMLKMEFKGAIENAILLQSEDADQQLTMTRNASIAPTDYLKFSKVKIDYDKLHFGPLCVVPCEEPVKISIPELVKNFATTKAPELPADVSDTPVEEAPKIATISRNPVGNGIPENRHIIIDSYVAPVHMCLTYACHYQFGNIIERS